MKQLKIFKKLPAFFKVLRSISSGYSGLAIICVGIIVAASSYFSGHYLQQRTLNKNVSYLKNISDQRKKKIVKRYQDLQREIQKFANHPTVIKTLGGRASDFKQFFQRQKVKLQLKDIMLVDLNDEGTYAFVKAGYFAENLGKKFHTNEILLKTLERAYMKMSPDISQFWYNPVTNSPTLFVCAPILKENGVL